MVMQDLMVDIETTGTNPDRHAIVQLSAVKFSLKEGLIDASDMFDRCLVMPTWRSWEEDTRSWWQRQKADVFPNLVSRMEEPKLVMEDFVKWLGPVEFYRFWAKPTTFDFMFVQSYMKDFDIPDRFNFREATDMNSFLRGKYFPEKIPDIYIPHAGDVHNALFDVINQIQVLFQHVHGGGSNDVQVKE